MPIEIKELIVRVSVSHSAPEQDPPKGSSGGQQGGGGGADKEQIIAECVEQILEILRNQNER